MRTSDQTVALAANPPWIRRLLVEGQWLFAAALFGYPFIAGVVSFLQVDSWLLSGPLRIVVALAALWMILRSKWPSLSGWRGTLILIWVAYGARLLYDHFFAGLGDAFYALAFFVSAALLPAWAMMVGAIWRQAEFARASLVLAFTACLMSLAGNALGRFGDVDLTEAAGRLTTVALNPVSLGQAATSALLCACVLWRVLVPMNRWILLPVIGVALSTLLATGSKGPALALGVCLLVWSVRRIGSRWPLVSLGLPAAAILAFSSENPLAERVGASSEDLSTLDRVVLAQNSIAQIADAPWFGSSFVELESGYYPHNIVLEGGLAFGIPLTLVLIALLLHGLRRAWFTLGSTQQDLLGLLYVQSLVEAMLTGAMFAATPLWVSLALLLAPHRRQHRLLLASHQPKRVT
jgi:hypothetical protein